MLTFYNAKNALLCLYASFILAKLDTKYPEVEKCTSDIEFLSEVKAGY